MDHSDIATTTRFYSTVSEYHLQQASMVTYDLLRISSAEPEITDHFLTILPDLVKKS